MAVWELTGHRSAGGEQLHCASLVFFLPPSLFFFVAFLSLLLFVLYFTLVIKLFLPQPTSFTFFFPPPHPTAGGKGEAAAWCSVADWG